MTTQESMLARHRILHEVGRGAMGAVYAARDRTTGAVVALKRLDPASLKSDAGIAGRFVKQARSARRLKHRNIVRIHDAGEAAGTAYVAMEMLEGENLRAILDRGPLPIARAIQIVHEIATGLAYAHLQGVIHGGIKPSNIVVLRSGEVKITDFGIGELSGAPGYLSPEQLRGDPVDHRCDLFSLGALFYEMLTGERPFEGDSPKEILENILRAPPPPPSELNRLVPRALDTIVLSMLAAEPAARMPGAPVLLRQLQGLEEGFGLGRAASADIEEAPEASAPPAEPEPALRAHEPALRTHEPSLAAEEFEHRRITDDEILEFSRAAKARERALERPSRRRPALLAALALVLAMFAVGYFTGVTGFIDDWSSRVDWPGRVDDWSARIERGIAAIRSQAAPPATQAPSRPSAPPPAAEAPKEAEAAKAPPVAEPPPEPVTASPAPQESPLPAAAEEQAAQASPAIAPDPDPMPPAKPLAALRDPPAREEPSAARAPERTASTGAASAQPLPRPKRATPSVRAQQPVAMARLILAISPQGELYVDGEHYGTTPPITTFDLAPGMHRIEVRSGSRSPYLTYMTVEAGDVRRIQYDFNAKGIRPPR